MTYQIIRAVRQVQVGAVTDYQIIRSPSGPRGQAAAQDGALTITNGIANGEKLNIGPFPHPATIAALYAHSDSGFAANQTITANQVRNMAVVASATLPVTAGGHDWSAAVLSPFVMQIGDIFQWVLPNPADAQATDLSLSYGSTP